MWECRVQRVKKRFFLNEKKKLKELKSQLATQQSIFTKPNTRSKAAKIASYRVCHVLETKMEKWSRKRL